MSGIGGNAERLLLYRGRSQQAQAILLRLECAGGDGFGRREITDPEPRRAGDRHTGLVLLAGVGTYPRYDCPNRSAAHRLTP